MSIIQIMAKDVAKSKVNRKEFQCPQCNESFRFRRHYDKHIEGHEQNNCKHCDKLFTVRKKLVIHLLEEHGIILQDFKFNCQFCEKVFAKKISLYQHFQTHAIGKHVCLQCGRIFSENSEYKRHQEKHKLAKSWKCDECDENFSRRQQYLTHIQDHGKYRCLTCNKSFSAHAKLAEHKREGHKISELEPKYVCSKCERSFHRSRALALHQRVHRADKSLQEKGICIKTVVHKGFVSKHLIDDREVGIKEGDKCEKESGNALISSASVVNEKNGSRIHKTQALEGKKPGKCIYCEYQSTSKANLKRHLQFHSEERKYICECCGASFYMLSTLKEHFLYVHSEKRNFPCPQCDKSFKRKSGLNRHLRDHSESRPFACHCGQFYKRNSHLIRHQESSHGLICQSKKLSKLRPNESGLLVPIEKESTLKSKCKKTKSSISGKDGNEGDVPFNYVHSIGNDQKSYTKKHDETQLNHTLKNNIVSEKDEGNHDDVKETSADKKGTSFKIEEVSRVKNGCADASHCYIPQEDAKHLPEVDQIVSTLSQMPLTNLEIGHVLESISSYPGNPVQNIGVVLNDQVMPYPTSCLLSIEQDSPNQLSIVEAVQIVPHDVLFSKESTIFFCLSSNVNYNAVENSHDSPE